MNSITLTSVGEYGGRKDVFRADPSGIHLYRDYKRRWKMECPYPNPHVRWRHIEQPILSAAIEDAYAELRQQKAWKPKLKLKKKVKAKKKKRGSK